MSVEMKLSVIEKDYASGGNKNKVVSFPVLTEKPDEFVGKLLGMLKKTIPEEFKEFLEQASLHNNLLMKDVGFSASPNALDDVSKYFISKSLPYNTDFLPSNNETPPLEDGFLSPFGRFTIVDESMNLLEKKDNLTAEDVASLDGIVLNFEDETVSFREVSGVPKDISLSFSSIMDIEGNQDEIIESLVAPLLYTDEEASNSDFVSDYNNTARENLKRGAELSYNNCSFSYWNSGAFLASLDSSRIDKPSGQIIDDFDCIRESMNMSDNLRTFAKKDLVNVVIYQAKNMNPEEGYSTIAEMEISIPNYFNRVSILEEVYKQTNSNESAWYENDSSKKVSLLGGVTSARSVSVGDMIELSDASVGYEDKAEGYDLYKVESSGFSPVKTPDFVTSSPLVVKEGDVQKNHIVWAKRSEESFPDYVLYDGKNNTLVPDDLAEKLKEIISNELSQENLDFTYKSSIVSSYIPTENTCPSFLDKNDTQPSLVGVALSQSVYSVLDGYEDFIKERRSEEFSSDVSKDFLSSLKSITRFGAVDSLEIDEFKGNAGVGTFFMENDEEFMKFFEARGEPFDGVQYSVDAVVVDVCTTLQKEVEEYISKVDNAVFYTVNYGLLDGEANSKSEETPTYVIRFGTDREKDESGDVRLSSDGYMHNDYASDKEGLARIISRMEKDYGEGNIVPLTEEDRVSLPEEKEKIETAKKKMGGKRNP